MVKVTRFNGSPLETAYCLAQISRSQGTTESIIEKALKESRPSLERIVDGYGHGSVSGMGHVGLIFDDVSLFDALHFFYMNHLQDGQEFSTRYTAFNGGASSYEKGALSIYKEVTSFARHSLEDKYKPHSKADEKKIKLRALDVSRAFLPLSLKTRFGGIMSGREWAHYCKYAPHLEPLIREKFQEDGVLFRHSLGDLRGAPFSYAHRTQPGIKVETLYPDDYLSLNKTFSSSYDSHNVGPRLPEGVVVHSLLDIGSLRDMNRHRGLSKYSPLLHETLKNRGSYLFTPAPYSCLNEDTYKDFVRDLYKTLPREGGNESLPLGHRVPFYMTGTWSDWRYIIPLRIKTGGHIVYRRYVSRLGAALNEFYKSSGEDFLYGVSPVVIENINDL